MFAVMAVIRQVALASTVPPTPVTAIVSPVLNVCPAAVIRISPDPLFASSVIDRVLPRRLSWSWAALIDCCFAAAGVR